MFKFRRTKGHHFSAERQKKQKELFDFKKTVQHGFPHKPSALAWDPKLKLLAIGTKTGTVKIFGRSGVEFYLEGDDEIPIVELFFLPEEGRLISLCGDNALHLYEVNVRDGSSVLEKVKSCSLEGRMKKISKCCLQSNGEHLLLGTEGGNIYLLNVKEFSLAEQIIYQDVVMQNVPDDYKVNPGPVEAIAIHPSDPNKILIGYQKGLMVLWDSAALQADQTYVGSQQLESVSWNKNGNQFMSAHNDGTHITWSTSDPTKQDEATKAPYGPFPCKAINKLLWNTAKNDNFVIFSGGLPRASYGDRHAVTVIQGDDKHQVLDFTSKVIDFFTISDNDEEYEYDDPHSLVVLAEEELVVIDLESEGWPVFHMPYLVSLHSSAIISTHLASNVPSDLWDKLLEAGKSQCKETYSEREWPISGGKTEESKSEKKELLLTGHEDGTVRFWDASSTSLSLMYKLNTAAFFNSGEEVHEEHRDENEEEWPPFRKVGVFDPFSDDPRMAVKKIELDVNEGVLAIAGTAGQVVIFKINKEEVEKELEVVDVNIVQDRDGFVWKGHDALTIKSGSQKIAPGFQPATIVQVSPPAALTALALHAEWSLVGAGTAHGLCLVDFVQNKNVMTKCTLNPNDLTGSAADTSISRRKSFKKSLRESFRKLRRGRSQRNNRKEKSASPTRGAGEDNKASSGDEQPPADDKVAEEKAADSEVTDEKAATDTDTSQEKATEVPPVSDDAKSEDESEKKETPITDIDSPSSPESVEVSSKPVERQIEARPTEDGLGSIVRCLYFAQCHIVNSTSTEASMWAGTNAGSVLIYIIKIPDTDKREVEPVTCQLAKEVQLKHGAPVVNIKVFDQSGAILPVLRSSDKPKSASEGQGQTYKVLITSEEQFKVFTLPQLKPYGKYKMTAHEGSMVRRIGCATFFSNAPDKEYSENCITCLNNQGQLAIFSVPDLKRQKLYECTRKEDITGIMTLVFGTDGQGFYLHSPCEFQRFTLSTKSVVQPNCELELAEGMRPEPQPDPEPEVANTEESAETATAEEAAELKEEPNKEEKMDEGTTDDKKDDDEKAKEGEESAEKTTDEDVSSAPVNESKDDDSKLESPGDITIDSVKDHLGNMTVSSTEESTVTVTKSADSTEITKTEVKTEEKVITMTKTIVVNSEDNCTRQLASSSAAPTTNGLPNSSDGSAADQSEGKRVPIAYIDEIDMNHSDL